MTATAIGWLVAAYADHGELIPVASLAAAAAWAAWHTTRRAIRRAEARRAEQAARPVDTDQLEQLYNLPAATHRNTIRKENRP